MKFIKFFLSRNWGFVCNVLFFVIAAPYMSYLCETEPSNNKVIGCISFLLAIIMVVAVKDLYYLIGNEYAIWCKPVRAVDAKAVNYYNRTAKSNYYVS